MCKERRWFEVENKLAAGGVELEPPRGRDRPRYEARNRHVSATRHAAFSALPLLSSFPAVLL